MALSPLQEGLYSLTTLAEFADGQPADDPYVIGMAADITGTLDVALLRDCAEKMLVRHPNLRASFFSRGVPRPVQIVPSRVELPWRSVTASPAEVPTLETAERRRPFDLERGPAIRFLLIELPDAHWRLVLTAHHIVIDGWSLPVFVNELMTLYRAGGDPSALPAAPRPYRDYIGWLAGRDLQASQRVWREHLAGLPGPTLLAASLGSVEATEGQRTALPRTTELRMPAEATARLAAETRSRGITVNTLMQMAWALVLSRLTDTRDVVFGVTVSGRPPELTGVETMVGLFINTVPMRVRLDPAATVGEQCRAVQRDAALLREHSYLGHAQLRALGGIGEMFDTLLVYENFPMDGLTAGGELSAGGATFRPSALQTLSHFPIAVAAHMEGGELVVLIEVVDGALGVIPADAVGRRLLTTAERLLRHWERPLRAVSVLFDDEAAPLRAAGPIAPPSPKCLPARFADVVAQTPDAPAVSWAQGSLTYRDLDEATNRLAAQLVALGVEPETPVAIKLFRGPRYVVAMLAVLKAGGMCVPMEPGMPAPRVNSILRQSGASIVLDEERIDELLEAARSRHGGFEPPDIPPAQAAYVVFTSGTTGEPKGVIGTHGAVGAYADDHLDRVLRPAAAALGRPLRIAHAWSFAFDAAWQPLVALLDGHGVHVVDEATQTDAEALVALIAEHGVDMIDTTPSMFAQLQAFGLLSEAPLTVLALGGRGARQRGLGPNPQRVQHHNDVGVQLLRPDRDHRRGGGGRHRRTRRAVHRAAHPAHPRLRAGLRVAPGAVRGDRRAVPGRRPAGPRLSGPRGGDRLPVRRRPVRGLRTDVSNRGPGAPVARRLTAIRGTRRRPGEDPRPPRGARRDRGRAGIAPRRPARRCAGAPPRRRTAAHRLRGDAPGRSRHAEPGRAARHAQRPAAALHGAAAHHHGRRNPVDPQREARRNRAGRRGQRRSRRRRGPATDRHRIRAGRTDRRAARPAASRRHRRLPGAGPGQHHGALGGPGGPGPRNRVARQARSRLHQHPRTCRSDRRGKHSRRGRSGRRNGPDAVAAQRPLALRTRPAAQTGPNRSHPGPADAAPRPIGDRPGRHRRRPRGAAQPGGPRHHDPGSGTGSRHR
ncbi:Surfactin synthase subunit 3 [Mycobacterium avium subsp. paratuberculosis]|nr:Surfactin synthase subunit 3 [Mycobacterium avium subsp. paratuberculosis]OVF04746.1 Surfactin synthase subunit 3 [Mycobacterium avium subsp. paratuberculosis]